MHDCLWLGCKRKIPAEFAMCREHWGILPERLRAAIWRSYVPGQTIETASRGWHIAIQDAEAWVRVTFGGEVKERYDPGKWSRLKRTIEERDASRARRSLERNAIAEIKTYVEGKIAEWKRRLEHLFGPRRAASLIDERVISRPHCRIIKAHPED